LGRAAIFGYKKDYSFEHSPRASWPRGEGRDGCEKPAGELHTFIEGEFVKEIGDLLDG
jgi:hypothetical protein